MSRSTYGKPVVINDGVVTPLYRPDSYNEKFIQDMVFDHPETLPIEEIDPVYSPLLPVCTELNTPAGPLDILLATPSGRLVIVETKSNLTRASKSGRINSPLERSM